MTGIPAIRLISSDSTKTETSASASECETESSTDIYAQIINLSLFGDMNLPTIIPNTITDRTGTDLDQKTSLQELFPNSQRETDSAAAEATDEQDSYLGPTIKEPDAMPWPTSLSQSKSEHVLENTVIHCPSG